MKKVIKKALGKSTSVAKLSKAKPSAKKIATKKQVRMFLAKGLIQYKRTIKALEDK